MSMTDLLRRLILGSGRRKTAAPAADDERAGALKQNMPLVPANTIAGRALVTVIAIMTFLASLAAGAGILVSDASSGWTDSIAREMTIQIKPASGHDVDADVAEAARIAGTTAGIAAVHVVSRAESERLLEPWLGTGLDLGELPVPRLIVLSLAPSARVDLGRLRTSLSASVPNALVDDHRLWLERLATMAHTLVVIVGVVFLLVLVAMALAIMFATHGAMAGNREIVDVLHFVGAADRFIAREFQRHFLRLGLRGGQTRAEGRRFAAGELLARGRGGPAVDFTAGRIADGHPHIGHIRVAAADLGDHAFDREQATAVVRQDLRCEVAKFEPPQIDREPHRRIGETRRGEVTHDGPAEADGAHRDGQHEGNARGAQQCRGDIEARQQRSPLSRRHAAARDGRQWRHHEGREGGRDRRERRGDAHLRHHDGAATVRWQKIPAGVTDRAADATAPPAQQPVLDVVAGLTGGTFGEHGTRWCPVRDGCGSRQVLSLYG